MHLGRMRVQKLKKAAALPLSLGAEPLRSLDSAGWSMSRVLVLLQQSRTPSELLSDPDVAGIVVEPRVPGRVKVKAPGFERQG